MSHHYRSISLSCCLTLPAIACDLPPKDASETADPMLEGEPPEELPQEEPPQEEPPQEEPPQEEPPQEEPPVVEPPTDQATVVAEIAGPLAVDDTWLFVGGGVAPRRVLKSGGEPELVVAQDAQPSSSVQLLAVDDTHVYWSGSSASESSYSILRAPKLGGAPSLVTDVKGPNYADPVAIAVDGEFLYLSQPDLLNSPPSGVVRRVPKAGGPALDLAPDFALSLAVGGSSVYWGRANADKSGDLIRADKDGQNSEVVFGELGVILDVVAKGDRVFWTAMDADETYVRTRVEGGETITVLSETGPGFLMGTPAVTADSLYWLLGGGVGEGGVRSVDLEGQIGDLVTAPASSGYSGWGGVYGARIAADESAVYWSYEGLQGGVPRIYRVAQ